MYTKCILFLRLQGEGGEVKEQTAKTKPGTGASNCLITNSGKRLQPCAMILSWQMGELVPTISPVILVNPYPANVENRVSS
jgi:hypothetical protein